MGGAVVTPRAVDYGDVQGLARFGHGHLPDACYLLLTVERRDAACAWLASAPVTTAMKGALPSTALNVAISAPGLRALGVPESVVSQFADEFVTGISADADRSRRLGDAGENGPQYWQWGAPGREPHVLVALYAASGGLDALRQRVASEAFSAAFAQIACLDTNDLGGYEEFGFRDGISEPEIDWDRTRSLRGDKTNYSNQVALGELLLGYPNEYDCYTERPLVSGGGANDELASAEDDPEQRDVGLNGSYLVMRDLRQDVRGFWSFAKTDELAAAFVGRKRDGTPLVPAASQNDFTYAADPGGTHCPYGAHVRRANPRNADFPSAPTNPIALGLQMLGIPKAAFHDDLTSSVRFHRIVRRGREYGVALLPEDARAPAPAGDPPRGLRFLCLNANIERQFEFVQSAWMQSDRFDGLYGESDPLLGNREPGPGRQPTDAFVQERDGAARARVGGLPRFVTVTGGAYFFLPSLRALRYFSRIGMEGTK